MSLTFPFDQLSYSLALGVPNGDTGRCGLIKALRAEYLPPMVGDGR